MNREETIEDILFDALHRIYVAEKFGNGTRREGVRKCLDDAYRAGLLRAAEICFDDEARLTPSKDDPCCKCDKSHAKADEAADLADKIRKEAEK